MAQVVGWWHRVRLGAPAELADATTSQGAALCCVFALCLYLYHGVLCPDLIPSMRCVRCLRRYVLDALVVGLVVWPDKVGVGGHWGQNSGRILGWQ